MKNSKLIVCNTLLIVLMCSQHVAAQSQYSEINALEQLIHEKVRMVKDNCTITTQLTKSDFIDLPIGISPRGCHGTTIIVIDSAYRAERGGTFFSAYASVVLPGSAHPIAFAARNIGFGSGGLTSSSSIKLQLVTTQVIQMGDHITMELPADGHNYVEFDCDGFKSINLKGNFIFSSALLAPAEPGASHVRASFEINTTDLNNFITTVNITPFKLKGLNDVLFEVHNAVVDCSDLINPQGFSFPQGYQHAFGNDVVLWRGFFLKELKIKIEGLAGDADETRGAMTFAAHNMVLDDLGVSGHFSARHLLSLERGNADGWPLSVDRLAVTLLLNKVSGGSLGGFIGIPVLGQDPVPYSALIEQESEGLHYQFSVAVTDSMEFDTPFHAKVKLKPGSVVSLDRRADGRIVPSAILHGELTSTGIVAVNGVRFENLMLKSTVPYITGGTFSTGGPATASGFPVHVEKVEAKVYDGRIGLGFDVIVGLMNAEDRGFSGTTHIDVLAKASLDTMLTTGENRNDYRRRQRWEFEKVHFGTIRIDCNTMAFGLNGALSVMDDDPVYGKGFHGYVNFSIRRILEKGVRVNAYFGSKGSFRYWHVDGYLPTAHIPIPPAMAITGFMGGASYKMVRQTPFVPDFAQLSEENAATVSTGYKENAAVYLPDETAGTSFLAGVTLTVGNENAVNADAMLEVAFNRGGGLRYAHFSGSAFFLTPIKSRTRMKNGEAPASSIYAKLKMHFDNDNNVFHANLSTYVNVGGIITGAGPNGLVGEAVIHAEPRDWYVYIGRPSHQFGVSIAGLADAQAYFMIGTRIEDLPLPPQQVREIFGDINMSVMRDDVAAASGKGFASGVHFKLGFDTGDRILPFYMVANVGAGADVMLRNYGGVQCVNGNGPIGVHGWYASGQAYVFIAGKVGIRVKGYPFDIVSLGLAAALQARLPNPSSMTGMLAGHYNIMGGLIKGKFNLKFTIGDECELLTRGAELNQVAVIEDVKPAGSDVSVFTAPQVSFNTGIGKGFRMSDLNDRVNDYRVVLDEFSVFNNGVVIPGTLQWNSSRDVALLMTADILPPDAQLRATVKVHWESKQPNGLWQPVVDQANTVIYESKTAEFATGAAPQYIPDENVVYSYPVKYQANFHVRETPNGYLKLKYSQEYLFSSAEGDIRWNYVVKFQDSQGKTTEVPLSYSAAQAMVTFSFPDLQKDEVYTMTFVQRPSGIGEVDQNLSRNEKVLSDDANHEVHGASNVLKGSISQDIGKEIYRSSFRTSKYATFAEKWQAMGSGTDAFDVANGHVAVIGKRMSVTELFDEIELVGGKTSMPLVQVSASPSALWLQSVISPLMYDLYPYDNDIHIGWRDPSLLGVKPLKGVTIVNSTGTFGLNETSFASGKVDPPTGTALIGYYISFYAFWDYYDLCNQVGAKYFDRWNSRPEGVKRLMAATGYTDLLEGLYPVDIRYVLPGGTSTTFSRQISIRF